MGREKGESVMLGFSREPKGLGFRRPEQGGRKTKVKPPGSDQPPSQSDQLETKQEAKPQAESLEKMLVEKGLINEAQVGEAVKTQKQYGGLISQILVELGYLRESELINLLVKEAKVPHLSLLDYEITKDVLALIPQELCLKHYVLPIDKLGRIVTVAMVNPLDREALEAIRAANPDLRIKPILCNWEHWVKVSQRVFAGEAAKPSEETDLNTFGESLRKNLKLASTGDKVELAKNRLQQLVDLAGNKYLTIVAKTQQVKWLQGDIRKVPFDQINSCVAVEYQRNGKDAAVKMAQEDLQTAEKDLADWLASLGGDERQLIKKLGQLLISFLK